MKPTHLLKAALIFGLISISGSSYAREKKSKKEHIEKITSVSGVITDQHGGAIFGAMVQIHGGSALAFSDQEGRYSLPKVKGGDKIVITAENYQTSLLEIVDREMDAKLYSLDGQVQVGYAMQDRDKVTVSTAAVKGDTFTGRPVINLVQMLQGSIAGLNISQTGRDIEGGFSMNVRGVATIGEGSNGAPLVLIDGVEGDINSVNPNDVESVTVLKDTAAATLYGSRAPFGVILIVTKR